ncbi:MAG: class I SAM-dependent methyltransferase [Pseudomonadota bacterium]
MSDVLPSETSRNETADASPAQPEPAPFAETVEAQLSANLASWNERVAIHLRDTTDIYDVEGFAAGNDTLMPIEANEIGDVSGLNIAHLQCHFGIDTISLARRGASVTGVDFSPAAIAQARGFAAREVGDITFVCAPIYDALSQLTPDTFDMVYVTWGTIGWMPDVFRWAATIGKLLKPGGRLYFADIHPTMTQLETEGGKLTFAYPRRSQGADGALGFDERRSYAGDGTELVNQRQYEWIHPLSDVLGALIGAGLTLEFLHEHDTLPWQAVPEMVANGDRMFRLPDDMTGPPVSISLKARKL